MRAFHFLISHYGAHNYFFKSRNLTDIIPNLYKSRILVTSES